MTRKRKSVLEVQINEDEVEKVLSGLANRLRPLRQASHLLALADVGIEAEAAIKYPLLVMEESTCKCKTRWLDPQIIVRAATWRPVCNMTNLT